MKVTLVCTALILTAFSWGQEAEENPEHKPIAEWKAHQSGWGLRVAISPDGKQIATAGSDKQGIHLWDPEKPGKRIKTIHTPYRHWSLGFDPTGKYLFAGGGPNCLVLNVEKPRPVIIKGFQPGIWGGTFMNDGKWIVSAAWNRSLRTYDFEGKLIHSHRLPNNSRCMVALEESLVALSQFTGDQEPSAIEVRDIVSGKLLQRFEGHEGTITCIDVCPTNNHLLVSTSADRSVRVWDRRTGKQHLQLAAHGGSFLAWHDGARFSPDGAYIATCADLPANSLLVWHLATGRLHWKSAPLRSGLIDIAWFPDKEGYRLAAMGKDNLVRVWKVEPDAKRHPIDLFKAREQITVLANQVKEKEDPADALELGAIVLTLWKNISEVYPADYLEYLAAFAEIQRRAKKYKESASSYEEALKIYEDNFADLGTFKFRGLPELKNQLGLVYALSGQTEKAEALLE